MSSKRRNFGLTAAAVSASLAGCAGVTRLASTGKSCIGRTDLYRVGKGYNAEIGGVEFERLSKNELEMAYEGREKNTGTLKKEDQINVSEYLEDAPEMNLTVEHVRDGEIGLSSDEEEIYFILEK